MVGMPVDEEMLRKIILKHGIEQCTMRIIKQELEVDYNYPKSYWKENPEEFAQLQQKVMEIAQQAKQKEEDKQVDTLTPTGTQESVEPAQKKPRSGKEKSKKKTSNTKTSSLADENEGMEKGSPKQKRNPFNEPCLLSPKLDDFLGGIGECSRPQTVKRIWQHIKENDLQDKKDKRYINCDSKMKSLFGVERVHMFTMNRLLSKHLISKDEQ